ncbi:MAG: dihydroxyacetone kinase subunit DhaL [Verrucomicrobiota bacterium]
MAVEHLTPNQIHEVLNQIANAIICAEPELSEADRRLGDGDHGIGMKRGMEAALEQLRKSEEDAPLPEQFSTVGMAMMSSMGGASGVVFGSLFSAGKKALKEAPQELTPSAIADWLEGAAATVMKRGGAKPGDKTMLDALVPAAEKARECENDSCVLEALEKVAVAAETGRDDSEKLIATMGRAKTLGEKSIGHPDAGACSVAVILRTMADTAKKLAQ